MSTHFWAIADTHLSFGKPKDMARFGVNWINHTEQIANAWRARVAEDDVVLLPGDISWAQTTRKIMADLLWLRMLPGRKVLVRGNHDHWWRDIADVRKIAEPLGFYALEGDCIALDDVLICGAMGYLAPGDPYYEQDARKDRYPRELDRLENALRRSNAQRAPGQSLVVMLHYPPFTSEGKPTAFVELLTQYGATVCLYGHLHRESEWQLACNSLYNGVRYMLVAADFLEMTPRRVWPRAEEETDGPNVLSRPTGSVGEPEHTDPTP